MHLVTLSNIETLTIERTNFYMYGNTTCGLLAITSPKLGKHTIKESVFKADTTATDSINGNVTLMNLLTLVKIETSDCVDIIDCTIEGGLGIGLHAQLLQNSTLHISGCNITQNNFGGVYPM